VRKRYNGAVRAHEREVWESATREQLDLIEESCGKALQESKRAHKREVWESATREQIEERCGKGLQESNESS
jgi:hypothetical protein